MALFLYCAVAVAARGIRWDENFEFAQVILGQIQPPPGHPLVDYVRNAFSIQTYSTALMLFLSGSPAIVCGMRNLLFIMATLLPVCLITARLAAGDREIAPRDMGAAAIAGLFILYGVHVEFDGSYPQFIWPDMFSNGHIGTGYALLVFFLFMTERIRAASLLLGLMPCIHIGQVPPVAMFAAFVCMQRARRDGWKTLARPAIFFAAGLAVCAAFRVVQSPFLVETPTLPGDVAAIWRGFVARHDIHRAIPIGNSWLALAGLMVVSGLAAWVYRRSRQAHVWQCLLLYAVCIAVIVAPTAFIHAVMQGDTPSVFLKWMPYRLLNHLPILLVAAVCGILAQRTSGRALLAMALLYCIVHPAAKLVVGDVLHLRYLTPSAGLLFLLTGATLTVLLTTLNSRRRIVWIAPLAGLVLIPFHVFGAACWIVGGCALAFARWFAVARYAAWPVMAAAAVLLLHQQYSARLSLPVPESAREIREYLAQNNEAKAVLLAPPQQLLLQAHTGHPVLSDMALPFMITYLPRIGPAIEKMYNDIYGISFLPEVAEPLSPHMAAWQTRWPTLSERQWQELAEKYSFDYVISPRNIALSLPLALDAQAVGLYKVKRP